MRSSFRSYLQSETSAAPLAVFRIIFGTMMLAGMIRFWALGWIDKLYIQPDFFFSYYGFDFVKPIGEWTYGIFAICAISAVGILLGYRYRLSATLFFLSFTYIELMDKTTYLNHYYFISLVAFLMIFLPANDYFSFDVRRSPEIGKRRVPKWTIDAIKLMLGIVYFYAGLAKLNSDWLLRAMPLAIWLPTQDQIPVFGALFKYKWMHYVLSWGGAIYDLSIPFLLAIRRTRWLAFLLVVFFHGLTATLFPIGMFPYIMILSTLIYFSPTFHEKILGRMSSWLKIDSSRATDSCWKPTFGQKWYALGLTVFFGLQILLPFRHYLYPEELFWNEEGFRFSWRVMLIEKAGIATFNVADGVSGEQFTVDNSQYLTVFQEKQMATQPDFIVQYAHHLRDVFESKGVSDPKVFVDSYVALNGRKSTRYIKEDVDLCTVSYNLKHRTWVTEFNDEIKGL